MNRHREREALNPDQRIWFLESDADTHDAQYASLENQIKELDDKFDKKLNKILWLIVTVAVMFSTSVVLFGANLAVK